MIKRVRAVGPGEGGVANSTEEPTEPKLGSSMWQEKWRESSRKVKDRKCDSTGEMPMITW